MFELPTSLEVDGKQFPIRNKGDFRTILDCLVTLDDYEELDSTERIIACLIIFYENLNSVEDVLKINQKEATLAMFRFFNCGEDESTRTQNTKLIDWRQDEALIASAVNKVAGKEIRLEPYMHWWTFMGYYMAIGESALATVVSIRSKLAKGKKLEKYEQDFKRDNPDYFVWKHKTEEQAEADKALETLLDNW